MAGSLDAVIFDLWGTLVPLPPAEMHGVTDRMAEIVGAPVAEFAAAWRAEFPARAIGRPLETSIRGICAALAFEARPESIAEAAAYRVAAFGAAFRPRADAVRTLEQLKARGLKLGLVTDCTDDVPGFFAASPLAPLVDGAVFSAIERMQKPDRRMYELVCERLAVSPYRCLYIGDGNSDELNGAVAVGMRAVQLRPGDTDAPLWDGPGIPTLTDVIGLADAASGAGVATG